MKKIIYLTLTILMLTACSSTDETVMVNPKFEETAMLICKAPYEKFDDMTLRSHFSNLAYNQILQNYMPVLDVDESLITYTGKFRTPPEMELLDSYATEYGEYDTVVIISFDTMFQIVKLKTKGDKVIQYEVSLQDEW